MDTVSPYNTDHAILRPIDDVLRRLEFANSLAEALFKLNAERGFVLALNGKWGSGKSSIINLAIRRLRHLEMSRLFTPERGSDPALSVFLTPEELEEYCCTYEKTSAYDAFVNEFVPGVMPRDVALRAEFFGKCGLTSVEVGYAEIYWRRLKALDDTPRTIIFHFAPWIYGTDVDLAKIYMAEMAKCVGSKLGNAVQESFAQLLETFANISAFAGPAGKLLDLAGAGIGAKIIGASAKWTARQLSAGVTLDEARHSLSSALAKQNARIIVIMDDLDRLGPAEAQLAISLVKSQGNLPNVIHLLSYDDVKIREIISKPPSHFDANFVDKIVQLSIHVPPISLDESYEIVSRQLAENIKLDNDILQDRLISAFTTILVKYISTPRCVAKLGNGLMFGWPEISEYADPIDFIIIETIRLFDPQIYAFVHDELPMLQGESPIHISDDEKKKLISTAVSTSEKNEEAITTLAFLFPHVASLFGRPAMGRNNDPYRAFQERRVCTKEFGEAYFRLGPAEGTVSRTVIDEVLAQDEQHKTDDIVKFYVEDVTTRGSERRVSFLESLSKRTPDTPVPSIALYLSVLKFGDDLIRLADARAGFLVPIDNRMRIRNLFYRTMDTLAVNQRFHWLEEMFSKGKSLTALAEISRGLLGDERSGGASGQGVVQSDEASTLRLLLVERVRAAAIDGYFWEQADPIELIWFWHQAVNDDEVKNWITSELEKDNALLEFIDSAQRVVYSTKGNYKSFNAAAWAPIFDAEKIVHRVRERLNEANLPEGDLLRIEAFLLAYERARTEGM